jgi:hypothetical protein
MEEEEAGFTTLYNLGNLRGQYERQQEEKKREQEKRERQKDKSLGKSQKLKL